MPSLYKIVTARALSPVQQIETVFGDAMLVRRWQAPVLPTVDQIKVILEAEGLEPYEQVYDVDYKTKEYRSPFEEIRILASGELLYNVAGNQLLLRPGDRIEIPSNTKRSHQVKGDTPCVCICAQRPF